MADIVDIYMECGDFHAAVKQSGLPIHVAHLKLLKSGCLKIQDKIRYGSKGAKLGGQAEEQETTTKKEKNTNSPKLKSNRISSGRGMQGLRKRWRIWDERSLKMIDGVFVKEADL